MNQVCPKKNVAPRPWNPYKAFSNKQNGAMANSQEIPPPAIPEYELFRCIGRGSYGEVWLARSVLGTFRAAKIIRRGRFEQDRPFEREWLGIHKFEPVSRTHPGLVAILHVGRDAAAGCFYYIMDVADDVRTGIEIDPEQYQPRTLASELRRRGRLPVLECVALGLDLAAALGHLHDCGLIHRDIKPSNIIFVGGVPKLADIGLVTGIGEQASDIGTLGFMPHEGPGSPTADIFSLGKVLYQITTGKAEADFPDLPTSVDSVSLPRLLLLNQIILKACAHQPRLRYQSAAELQAALTLVANSEASSTVAVSPPTNPLTRDRSTARARSGTFRRTNALRVCLLYKSSAHPDNLLVEVLHRELARRGCEVFLDQHLALGVEGVRQIEDRIRRSQAVIVLLSAASVDSEMLACEVEMAHQGRQEQTGRPLLLPVRVQYTGPLPDALGPILNPLQCYQWASSADDERLVGELLEALETSRQPLAPVTRLKLESIGGAVPLDSEYYVTRPTDHEFESAILRGDSIVLVKGARQMGKTSLLARGMQQARRTGARVVLTDLQKLNASHLASIEAFYLTLGDFLADQLDLKVLPEEGWDKRRSPNTNFERFLRREVLGVLPAPFVWALDEVDRLFTCPFGSEVFGLFRAWHNERALDPCGPWSRLTLAIAYATEAHLFITDVNQSPFNVGTRLALDDFTFEQVADLNGRHGTPLQTEEELQSFFDLVGGQPYLVRRGLNELAQGAVTFANFAAHADRDEGVFGDHLRRMLVLLARDPGLTEAVGGVLNREVCPSAVNFYRLRSAGLMKGDAPQSAQFRCNIYVRYLKDRLK
jgi:serine/threonine protein kinase